MRTDPRRARTRAAGRRNAETRGARAPERLLAPPRPPLDAPTCDAAAVAHARDAAVEALLRSQQEPGWWKGELETNVTMDAEDLLLREFLGIRDAARTEAAARWIRRSQRSDGTWATFYEGPADLSVTVEAYVALRLAGDRPDDPHMAKAAEHVRSNGGLESTRVFTRLWLALFGLWPWEDLPALPPEVILLPSFAPANIYDFACWARQTVVALTVVGAHRPVRPLPFGLDELRTGVAKRPEVDLRTTAGRLVLVDRLLRRYERRPIQALRTLALRRAERWILRRQEADGCWGGIQPPWVYSLLALHLLGYPLEHPALAVGLAGLEGFSVRDGDEVRLEACQSPVWDTALAVIALADAGLEPPHPAVARAASWLVGQEVRVRGDWAVRRPHLEPSGWAFEFENDHYPDIDDAAEVLLALRRAYPAPPPAVAEAIERGRRWVVGMASADGGWAAFDADNTSTLVGQLPFCDFGEVTDPPSADVTAHVVEMLAKEPSLDPAEERALARGVDWLWRAQETDGSWFGRWGANYVYGTGAVVPALVAAGVAPTDPRLLAARAWLLAHQNDDGGWGEDLRSYVEKDWAGRGASTASQTAWALLALLALGDLGEATRAGVAYLVATQRADGTWDEPWFTGTGFPGDFYINYHLYRQVFPTGALGRFLAALDPTEGAR